MRKFKLIKEYPNSSSLGTIFTQHDERSWELDYFIKNSEFFEEVIEKDYEILSYKNPTTDVTFRKIEANKLLSDNGNIYSLDSLSIKDFHIYSIKRLSDGEVFTVGDRIENGSYVFKLLKIEFESAPADKGTGKLSFINDSKVLGKWLDLKNFKKVKTPLFTTEDGIDIYGDNTVWLVYKKEFLYSTYCCKQNSYLSGLASCIKVFSTKETAEEYVLMNKPCLSINDVMTSQDGLIFAEKKLKQLVKSRL